uniref:cellulase n=1 Tax=Oryza rufipogon TaxID=4529 RepID=A0A0E0RGM8_ORYRU
MTAPRPRGASPAASASLARRLRLARTPPPPAASSRPRSPPRRDRVPPHLRRRADAVMGEAKAGAARTPPAPPTTPTPAARAAVGALAPASPLCESIPNDIHNCSCNVCMYEASTNAGDTGGKVGTDTFAVGTAKANLAFGCVVASNIDTMDGSSGIVGLGRTSWSLVTQTGVAAFSYCLAPHDAGKNNALFLGSTAKLAGGGKTASMPFVNISGNDLSNYYKTADAVMCILLPDSETAAFRTKGGLLYVDEWNSLQHPVASAFLAAVYSDYMQSSRKTELSCSGQGFSPSDLRKFAKSQADYLLGSNPMKISCLVGYGDRYPERVHHRGTSIPEDVDTGLIILGKREGRGGHIGVRGCWPSLAPTVASPLHKWLETSKPNPNVTTDALVGGMYKNNSFVDERDNFFSSIHPFIHPLPARRDTHQQLRRRRRQPRQPRLLIRRFGVAEMNCETCQLKELELEPREIKDVQCGLPELEKEVDEKINQFVAWVEKHPNRSSQVCLSFFDEKNKLPSWFGNKTERIYWEQWFINLHVISPKRHGKSHSSKALTNIGGQALEESSSRRAALESSIHEVLFQIINFANEKKDHIPPIPDRIFNHEISIPSSSDSMFGWNTDVLRRVLNSGHPYSL